MRFKYFQLMVILLFLLALVGEVGCNEKNSEKLEYHRDSEPIFTLDGETLIKNVKFCFEKNGEILCRPIGDFIDNELGVACDYTMFGKKEIVSSASGVEFREAIYYKFKCELETPSSYVCPLAINLNNWPTKVLMDNFEENISGELTVTSPFGLSGSDRGIVVVVEGDYISTITKEEDFYLNIYSIESKTFYESQNYVKIIVYPRELNISDLSGFGLIEPEVKIGPEETLIEIKDFFIGILIGLDPQLPYVNMEIKITPENEIRIESIVLEYESLLGKDSEVLVFDNANKSFYFSRQVRFFGSSWLYPFDTYLTELKTEDNISFKKHENRVDVPGHSFLEAKISFENNTISVKIERNVINSLKLFWVITLSFMLIFCASSAISKKSIRRSLKDSSWKLIGSLGWLLSFAAAIGFVWGVLAGIGAEPIPILSIFFWILVLVSILLWKFGGKIPKIFKT